MYPQIKEDFTNVIAVDHLLFSGAPYSKRVFAFEKYLSKFPQVSLETKHEFIDGMCKREVIFEANMLATGEVHIKDHMDVMLEGEMLVATEDGFKHLVAPCTMTTKAGTKKAGIALKRTKWISYHPTNAKSGEELEEEIILKVGVKHDIASYNKLLEDLGMSQEEVDLQVHNTEDFISMPVGYNVSVKESRIHNLGLFSTSSFNKGDYICPAKVANNRTLAGRYTNHSATPNSEMVQDGINVVLVAIEDIKDGVELTTCYRKTLGVLSCQQ